MRLPLLQSAHIRPTALQLPLHLRQLVIQRLNDSQDGQLGSAGDARLVSRCGGRLRRCAFLGLGCCSSPLLLQRLLLLLCWPC